MTSEQRGPRDAGLRDSSTEGRARRPRRVWRFVLLALAITGVVLVVYVLGVSWFLFSGSSPIRWHQRAPEAYIRMVTAVGGPESYPDWRSLGGFIDNDYAWRIRADGDRVRSVAASMGLEPVEISNVPPEFFDAMPRGWSPQRSSGDLAFQTPGFIGNERGGDGSFLFVYWDSAHDEIYVWDKENF